MKTKINNMNDLNDNLEYLSTAVIMDINTRITDWMSSGGSLEDGYIKQQFRYAENIINSRRNR